MIKVIKDDDKYICRKVIPKGLSGEKKYHFEKTLFVEIYNFITAESGDFFEFEYIYRELPDDEPKCIDWEELVLIVKKYKLDQTGFPYRNEI